MDYQPEPLIKHDKDTPSYKFKKMEKIIKEKRKSSKTKELQKKRKTINDNQVSYSNSTKKP